MAHQILKMSTSAISIKGVKAKLNYVEKGATKDVYGNVNCWGFNCYDTAKEAEECFKQNRRFYNTNKGRMLTEEIISLQGEISQEKRLEIVEKYLKEFYPDNQVFYGEHLKERTTINGKEDIYHYHLEIDTTNFVNGKKIHQTKQQLEQKKNRFKEICQEYNLELEGETITKAGSYSRTTYETQKRGKAIDKDRLVETYKTLLASATTKEEFIQQMNEHGYSVEWGDKKNIVFTVNADILTGTKNKFRLNTIQKDYGMDILDKNDLIKKFDENKINIEKNAGKTTINIRKQKTNLTNTIKIKASKAVNYKNKNKKDKSKDDYEI